MTGLLPSGALTELDSASPSIFVTAEIDYEDGTAYYAKAAVNSVTNGSADTRVVRFGRLPYKVAPLQNSLQPVPTELVLADTDFVISNRFGKGQREANLPVRIYLESPNFSRHLMFNGFVSSARSDQPGVWSLELRTRDILLDTYFPRYELNIFDFSTLTKGAKGSHRAWRRTVSGSTLGGYTPLVYGYHDAFSHSQDGAVPCPEVDTASNEYIVSLGWTNPVRIFSAGVLKTVTTDYTIVREIVNGRYYTLIDFVVDQGTNAVTADVEGYETVGDGTGTLIYDPVSVIQHLITNFVLNDYGSGDWLPTDTSFFDTASWAEVQTLLNYRANGAAYASSRYISNQMTGKSALDEFCASFGLVPYWTEEGKVALAIDDPTLAYPDTYVDDPFLRWEELRGLKQKRDLSKQANRIIVSFDTVTAGGDGSSPATSIPKEMYQIEVLDPMSLAIGDDQLSSAWGPTVWP